MIPHSALEDGILKKVKRKRTKSEIERDNVNTILDAASKGQVELPPEERFIIDGWKQLKNSENELSDRLAAQGFSLIEQARAKRPKDLMERNLKYMRYVDKKRKLDTEKAKKIVLEHFRKKDSKDMVRKERNKITCLREPKKRKKETGVFSDADFAVVGKKAKKLEKNTEYL
ncbi:hypothetical protein DICVIV_01504 [Dictyocaulus viviparus]|uniref:Uncharacterized protein n=1 Tax=Dictyocaulus viviparus TaxID=29172 RepID=A0A0D8Y7Y8_DICVI|nr:hypothetical protein DICVIV_01504 [Dictyocaulus viviparus]